MFQSIRSGSNPTVVLHATGATVFGAVGEAVPPTAQMGLAEARERTTLAATRPAAGRTPRRPAAALRWSPSPSR